MSLLKIGGYTGGAAAVGGALGAVSNDQNRTEGALKGALMGGGLVGGSIGAYKGLNVLQKHYGLPETSSEQQEAIMKEAGGVIKNLYSAANSKEGLDFIAKRKAGEEVASPGALGAALKHFSRDGGAYSESTKPMDEYLKTASTGQAVLGTGVSVFKSTIDMTNDLSIKPGATFVKNALNGQFKDMSVNQATSFASNTYGAYAIGEGIYNQAGGEDGAFGGGLAKATVANGLQMKGSGLYNGVKAYVQSGATLKGIANTYKFSKYSSSEL